MFREIFEAQKGEDAIYGVRKMNLDVDSLFTNAKSYKDVEKTVDALLKDKDDIADMKDGMSDKDFEKYMNYMYDIQDDPKGALAGLNNPKGTK